MLVSKFPKQYLTPFLYGEGYSGVIVSLTNIVTLTIGNHPDDSVMIYFNVGIALFILTIILLWHSNYSSTYNHYVGTYLENSKRGITSFTEIIAIAKNIWPNIVIFNIMVGTLVALHPGLTSLVVSENYGNGSIWNGKFIFIS